MDQLITAEHRFPAGAGQSSIERMTGHLLRILGLPEDLPARTASSPVLIPEVNHGRWIVRCPFCPSAQIASIEDHRFYCTECFHAGSDVAGAWLGVHWPTNRAALERALLERPDRRTRNWTPDESTADLHRENDRHLAAAVAWRSVLEERATDRAKARNP